MGHNGFGGRIVFAARSLLAAAAVVFLCSDAARCITGQTLVVDSGQVMVR